MVRNRRGWHSLLTLLALVAVLVAACGQQPAAGKPTIKIGSKNFTEVYIVAEMQALLLENAGFTVERRFDLGGTPVAHAALTSGDIDMYGEYTSTGLQEVLKLDPPASPDEIITTLRAEYERQFNLTWLEPASFNNTNAFVVTQETAQQYGLQTYSDLAARANELTLGGPPEFPERQDTRRLQEIYGGFQFGTFVSLGTGSTRYEALQNGQIDVAVAFSTDGQISGQSLVLLQDDKGAYPTYRLAPVIRKPLLDANPDIAEALNRLAPLLTEARMADLNWRVDGPDKQRYQDVARDFLNEQGLIP